MSEIEMKLDALSAALDASVRAFVELEDAIDSGVVTPSHDSLVAERDEALVREQELSCAYGRLKVLEKKAAFERDKALAKVKDLTEARDEALVRVKDLTEARDAALAQVINLTTERDSAIRDRAHFYDLAHELRGKLNTIKRNLGDL